MSYSRDRDAYTRGSGAIAASDWGNARRARERRAKLARFERDDRMLARFTMGPRGGMGAIDSVNLGVTGRPTIRPVAEGGAVEGGSGVSAPTSPSGGRVGGPNGFAYQPPAQYGYQVAPVRTWIDPGPLPPPTATGTPVSAPASTPVSNSTKKWLLIAALAAGGAYLYSRSKRGGG